MNKEYNPKHSFKKLTIMNAFSIALLIGVTYLYGWPALWGLFAGIMLKDSIQSWIGLKKSFEDVEKSRVDLQIQRQSAIIQNNSANLITFIDTLELTKEELTKFNEMEKKFIEKMDAYYADVNNDIKEKIKGGE